MPVNAINSTWTEERTELLKRLWGDGDSCSQIAAALNCGFSRNAIIGKIARLGLSGRVKIAKPRSKVAHDRDRGTKQRIVAKMLKVRSPSNGGTRVEPVVIREEPPTPPDFLGIRLLDLERGQCRFPRGEGINITFCGQPVVSGESWCRFCYRIVYAPPRPRVERPYLPTGGSKPRVT